MIHSITKVLKNLPQNVEGINWDKRQQIIIPSLKNSHVKDVIYTKVDFFAWVENFNKTYKEEPMLTIEQKGTFRFEATVINEEFTNERNQNNIKLGKFIKGWNH